MGGLLSGLWRLAFGNPQKKYKVTIIGLDNAGKTTALYKLFSGVVVNTIPTVGSNCEVIERDNVRLQCWDLAGQTQYRLNWKTFFSGTNAILFVVDSADRSRIDEARKELFRVLEDESTANCCICVLANKMDLPNSLSQAEVTASLQLTDIPKEHAWGIFPTCAFTGQGLEEVIDWLVLHLKDQQ